MKKIFSFIIICILFIGIFMPSGVVNATQYDDCVAQQMSRFGQSQTSAQKSCFGQAGTPNFKTVDATNKAAVNACVSNALAAGIDNVTAQTSCANDTNWHPTQPTKQTQPNAPSNSCDIFSAFSLNCVFALLKYVSYVLLGLMSLVLWLAGYLLDFVLKVTIIQMSAKVANMGGIDVAWKVIRDVLNMAFIFVLLYNAILVIISRRTTDQIKGIIVGIVITALLINFSMFFTKVIIDASNIVTVGFYQSIQASGQTAVIQNGSSQALATGGISGSFMNALHMTSFFNSKDIDHLGGAKDNQTIFIIGLMGSILFLILALVFFAVSALFIVRFIVLLFLLILSPVGFIGFGLPQLRSYQDQWWKTLMGQAIFAPLYMILTWVILTLMSSKGFMDIANNSNTGQPGSWSSLLSGGDGSSMGLVLNFVLVIGLIIMSLKIAKDKSSEGSNLIGQFAGKLTTLAGGAMLGGGALLARQTLGRAGNAAANSERLKNKASQSGVWGWGARQTLKASNLSAKSTFDARSSMTKLSDTLGVKTDFGKSGKTTVRSVLDAKAKSADELVKMMTPSEEAAKAHTEAMDKHFKSEEYKKDPHYIAAENEKKENEAKKQAEEQIKNQAEKDLENLKKQREYATTRQKQEEIDAKIKEKDQVVKDQQRKIEEITKNKTAQDAKEAYEKEQKDKNALKSNRINSYADVVGKSPWYMRYAINAATGSITTKADRKAIAAKIRSQAKQKSSEQQMAELALKIEKEKKEKESGPSEDKDKKPETTPAEKPKP